MSDQASTDQVSSQPDPNFSSPTGPLYIGPDDNGNHQVQTSDGQIYSLPFDGLTPDLQNDAVQHAAAQPALLPADANGGPNLSQMSTKQQMALHNAITDPTTGTLQNQQQNVQNLMGSAPAGLAGAPQLQAQPPADAAPPPRAPEKPLPMAPDTNATLGSQPTASGTGGGRGQSSAPQTADQTTKDEVAGAAAQEKASADTDAAKLRVGQTASSSIDAEAKDQVIKRAALDKQVQDTLTRAKAVADNFAGQQIDPERYWKDHSKIAARLSMIVSGLGSGVIGKDNPAIKSYADAQERDVAAQKYNIEHGKEASDVYSKLLSDYRATGLDQRQAHDATMSTIKDKMMQDDANAVLAQGGPAAHAKFLQAIAPLAQENKEKQANIAKTYADTTQANAAASLARASAAHTRAETAQMAVQGGVQRDLKAGQTNISKGFGYKQLPAEQQRALVQNAQASKMLIPGVGITQREIQPEEQDKSQDLETANKLIADIDSLSQHTGLDRNARNQASSKAQALKVILPKVLGSQARLSEGAQAALDNIVPDNPGDLFTLWRAHSDALRGTLGEARSAFHKNLGLTPFNPIQFKPTP